MSTPPAAGSPAPLAESLAITRQRLLEAQTHDGHAIAGRAITTGFADLDEALDGGLQSGELAVVASRANVGASTLVQTMARNAARSGVATLLVSSTDAHQINRALLSATGRVPYRHLNRGGLTVEEWERVDRALAELSDRPLWVVGGVEPTVASVVDALVRHEACSIRLLVVDGALSFDLGVVRELAKTRGVAVLFVDRVNCPAVRADRPPLMEDLRSAPEVAEMANQVILVHRDDVIDAESRRPGEADLMLCLNRRGVTRDVAVAFQGHYRRFVDLAH